MKHYDYFVIGAGSGGVSSARLSSSLGAKVGIAEEYKVGGTCVIRGCVPKKLMVYSSHFHEDIKDAKGYGWDLDIKSFSWSKLLENKDKEIERLNGIYINMLEKSGVDIYNGKASFIDNKTILVGKEKITADKFLIATGGKPSLPNIEGIEHAITSNEAFYLKDFPKDIAIIGGGYIAVEFAGIFNGLGSNVNLIYRGDNILRGFDNDIRNFLSSELEKKSINIKTNENIIKIEKINGKIKLYSDNSNNIYEADEVMYCTGRNPNIEGLNLENIGIKINKDSNSIIVDEYSKTSVDNIFAVGDVTNRINLTPVAIKEGRALAERLFLNKDIKVDYNNVASAVFSQPSVATVGLTEEEAIEKYNSIDIYKSEFRPMKNTLSGNSERTMMKLIVDKETDIVIGAHMVGADAAEIIQGIAIAIKAKATKADFDSTVGIHPSAAEEFVTMREKFKTI